MLLQGDFSIYGGWLYISFVVNLSVCYAFYCLGMFYFVLKTPLTPFDPVPKFLCIKAVLFLSFWQVWEILPPPSSSPRATPEKHIYFVTPPLQSRYIA